MDLMQRKGSLLWRISKAFTIANTLANLLPILLPIYCQSIANTVGSLLVIVLATKAAGDNIESKMRV
jgi:hypothetical protein